METGIRSHRQELESSPFSGHFRVGAVPRLKVQQLLNAPNGKAGFLRQPSDRLTRWPFVHCPAGSNATSAYEIDIKWRTLGHLAPAQGTDNIDLCND